MHVYMKTLRVRELSGIAKYMQRSHALTLHKCSNSKGRGSRPGSEFKDGVGYGYGTAVARLVTVDAFGQGTHPGPGVVTIARTMP
jgi:hypothetical protein